MDREIYATFLYLATVLAVFSCKGPGPGKGEASLARDVRAETQWTWDAYRTYAWGQDNLLPISKGFSNWYSESLSISPVDAYSTLHIMGLVEKAREIESYVTDNLDFDKDIFMKTFEVNIRILGGLLSMYELSGNPEVLDKAEDFGRA